MCFYYRHSYYHQWSSISEQSVCVIKTLKRLCLFIGIWLWKIIHRIEKVKFHAKFIDPRKSRCENAIFLIFSHCWEYTVTSYKQCRNEWLHVENSESLVVYNRQTIRTHCFGTVRLGLNYWNMGLLNGSINWIWNSYIKWKPNICLMKTIFRI